MIKHVMSGGCAAGFLFSTLAVTVTATERTARLRVHAEVLPSCRVATGTIIARRGVFTVQCAPGVIARIDVRSEPRILSFAGGGLWTSGPSAEDGAGVEIIGGQTPGGPVIFEGPFAGDVILQITF